MFDSFLTTAQAFMISEIEQEYRNYKYANPGILPTQNCTFYSQSCHGKVVVPCTNAHTLSSFG